MNKEIPDYARQILANQMAIQRALYYLLSPDKDSERRADALTGLRLAQNGAFEMLNSQEGQA